MVQSASLHIPKTEWIRVYAAPFLPLYAVYFYYVFWLDYFETAEFGRLCFILLGAFHAVVYLSCKWSVHINTLFTMNPVTDVFQAKSIKIVPTEHNGSSAICELKQFYLHGESHEVTFSYLF